MTVNMTFSNLSKPDQICPNKVNIEKKALIFLIITSIYHATVLEIPIQRFICDKTRRIPIHQWYLYT